jgi:tRNA threonylcarbamoyladenosine dehydratase
MTGEISPNSFDAERAFGTVDRLFGAGAYARLRGGRCVVIGVGGVGSWAAEALVRAGVGALTLIDMDHIAQSNLNRQVLALTSTIGQSKVVALRERIALINPLCNVNAIDDFATEENIAALLPEHCSYVLDCIDAARVKIALIVHCRAHKIPLVVCGAAGGKVDASRLAVTDLAHTTHDALLARVRAEVRRRHKVRADEKLRVLCVSSNEPRVGALPDAEAGAALACAGYGSLVSVTATMGMIAAGVAIRAIATKKR